MGMAKDTLTKSISHRTSNHMRKSISSSSFISTIVISKKKSKNRSNKRTTKFIKLLTAHK
jgi:hypothetical protein